MVSLAHRHLGKAAQEFIRLCRATLDDLQVHREDDAAEASPVKKAVHAQR